MGLRFYERQFRPFWERMRSRGRVVIGSRSRIEAGAILSAKVRERLEIGRECRVHRGAMLAPCGGFITLGDRVSVNPYTILYGHGGLRIGNDVRIAAHCVIIPGNHGFADPEMPIRRQGMRLLGITIEDDVWIGANSVVLDGSYISSGCVIGAGSVVRGHLEPMGIYVGAPVRKIGTRGGDKSSRNNKSGAAAL